MGDLATPDMIAWLLGKAGGAGSTDALVADLSERLVATGIDLSRMSVSVPTLHPELAVEDVTWTPAGGAVVRALQSTVRSSPAYLDSPVARIHAGEDEIRCRLDGEAPDLRFGVCRDMKALGGTDYLAVALPFRDGRRTFVSWTTRRPGGFTDDQLALLRALVPSLALRLELASAGLALRSLLEVYLGHNAAQRVLAGAFRRGGGETVRAAVWSCDMRGFTSLADTRPAAEVLATLDRYFETVCAPINDANGEVLKFVGDAVLAIFPVGDDEEGACRRALGAAKTALDGVRLWAAARPDPVRVGIALHLGDVTYGNIGAQRRLDFTVIGAAVNEVCRVESLCKELGRDLLLTDRFAAHVQGDDLIALGPRALRGVAEPRELFGVEGY